MIGFAGAVRLDGAPLSVDTRHRWKNGLAEPGRVTLRASTSAILACQSRTGTRVDASEGPVELPGGALLIADARLDDRVNLANALGLPFDRRGDAALAGAAWLRWGPDAIRHLTGDVALAHWDPAARRLTLARDALGVRTLYYFDAGETLFFASAIETLLALPELPRDLDDLGIADLLTGGGKDPERTPYRAIRRVPPGSAMTFRAGARETRVWWTLEGIAPVRLARDEDYVEAARSLLDQAVASRLPASGKVASMLSGGFDSAGVTATAARLLGDRRLLAFTRVAGAPHPYDGLDERSHAASVAALYPNIDWTVIDTAPDAGRPSADREAVARGHLQMASFNVDWFDPVHAAAEAAGAEVLLVGNSGNHALSYSGERYFTELVQGGKWIEALGLLRQISVRQKIPLGKVLRDYLPSVLEPRAFRHWRLSRRHGGASPWLEHSLLSPDFLATAGFDERARRVGVELPYMPRGTGREIRYRLMRRQGGHDSNDYFRRKRRFMKLDPYQDRRLIEFALGVPEAQYMRDGVRRSLGRRVLADRLPAPLLAANLRGRQSPEWYAMATLRRGQLAETLDRIARSPLASRVLDVPRIRALFDSWPADAGAARQGERLYGAPLYRAIVIGGFLAEWETDNG